MIFHLFYSYYIVTLTFLYNPNSDDKKRPIHFILGQNQVMKGWEEGLKDMCVGEMRELIIPPGEYQQVSEFPSTGKDGSKGLGSQPCWPC